MNCFNFQTGHCTVIPKDPRDVMLLKHATDGLYQALDRAHERLGVEIKELEAAGKPL
jgi:hypothetical protein